MRSFRRATNHRAPLARFLKSKEELVTRSPNPTDRRVYRLALTDKARDALDAYFYGTDLEGI